MVETQQFATFHLDDLLFGVEVRQVQEVIRFQEMTRVPLAPPVVQGLINLRGQIVTAVDLRRRLALPQRAADRLPMNVVVRTPDGAVSLLVDEIGDVVEVSADAFERPPETVTGIARDLIQGVYKMKDALLLVLDTQKSVQVSDGPSAEVALSLDHSPDLASRTTSAAVEADSLFERLGGQPAIEAVVAGLYERVLADAEVAPFFRNTDMAILKRRQAEFLGQAFGGPATYEGPPMKQVHAAMEIEPRHFDRVANHLAATLEAAGVAQELIREALSIAGSLKTDIVSAARTA